VTTCGCLGLCSHGPLVRVETAGQADLTYESVTPNLAQRIVDEQIAPEADAAPGPHDTPSSRGS
jgi:(2Fe-2S) ferredoxin